MNVSKNGGFSSRPPGHVILKPLGVEALASPNYLLSRRFWSKDEAPHNGDFGRKKMEHPPFF